MRLYNIRYYSICLLITSSIELHAQDTTTLRNTPQIWNLQQALEYAKKNNIQVNTLRLNQKNSEQQQLKSRAAVLPDLYSSASQTANNRQNQNINLSGSYALNSGLTVYRGGYLKTDIRQKELTVQSAHLSVLEEENAITLQIASAYLNILLDKENIIYAQDLVKISQAQLEQARQKYALGSIARRDVVQFEAQLTNDQYFLITSQNSQKQNLLTLRSLLQLPSGSNIDIVAPDTVHAEHIIAPFYIVEKHALQNRPEIKNSELNIQISEFDLTKARTGYLPFLSASGSLGTTTNSNNSIFGNPLNTSGNQFGSNFYQQAGITLSIPIFSNQTNKANVALARIGIDQARLNLLNTRIALSQQVEQAYIAASNAESQYNAAREQLKYNQEVFRIANEELRLGATTILTFYQQRNLYIQALQNYTRAKYNAALSVSIYNFYAGIPITL